MPHSTPSKYRDRLQSLERRLAWEGGVSRGRVGLCLALLCLGFMIVRIWLSDGGEELFYRVGQTELRRESNASENPESLSLAVVMGTLAYDKLRLIGGTGHWFHLVERLLPLLPLLASDVWSKSSEARSKRDGKLYIVFQEKYGSEDLDSFSGFLLATIISGGLFESVVIGHAATVTVLRDESSGVEADSSGSQPVVEARNFAPSLLFSLDPEGLEGYQQQPFNHSSQSQSQSQWTTAHTRRFLEVFHISWNFHAKKKFQMLTPPVWELFNQASNRSCPGAAAENRVVGMLSPSRVPDHLSNPPPRLAKKIRRWRNGSFFDPPIPVAVASVSSGSRTLLIYQRDQSRRLLRAEAIAARLQRKLGAAGWRVQLLIHSSERRPCELVRLVRSATVLLTPHGFQSILLLFQPLHSLLVELHPSLYFKPEVFGLVQAGLRENIVGAQRSYLAAQSDIKSWHMTLLSAIMNLFPLRDAGYCTGNALCRYLARLQAVELEPRFEDLLVHFVHAAFITK